MKFLDGLSPDIKKNLLSQLRVLWTHGSTGIEGNTLTLGETAFVLSEGLTIKGKPLKDHRDIHGHARAVDLLLGLVEKDEFTKADLFDLHRLVLDEQVLDPYKPVGDWKRENNSTAVVIDGRQEFLEFSDHREVPELMEQWLGMLAEQTAAPKDLVRAYARLHVSFVAIHPFWDGNGRVARLVSNLPCLKAGEPPIVIPREKRFEYLSTLAKYTSVNGVPCLGGPLVHENKPFETFCLLCEECRRETLSLVEDAHALKKQRDRNKKPKNAPSPS
jgi:Fic family protein